MKDVMLDLETLGNRINPAIVQISAVQFDIHTGKTGAEFSVTIDRNSSIGAGLEVNQSTVDWWAQQDPEAQALVFGGDLVQLADALDMFDFYIKELKLRNIKIWGNGIRADNVWLDSAYKALGREMPVPFWADCDVRTIVDLGQRVKGIDPKKTIKFEGVPHNAIDDCKHQIKYVCEIFNALKS